MVPVDSILLQKIHSPPDNRVVVLLQIIQIILIETRFTLVMSCERKINNHEKFCIHFYHYDCVHSNGY